MLYNLNQNNLRIMSMKLASIFVVVFVGLSCHAETDSIAKCRNMLKKAVTTIEIPKELTKADEYVRRRMILDISPLLLRPKNEGNKYEKDYFNSLNSDDQTNLDEACIKFHQEVKENIWKLNCKLDILDKMVNFLHSDSWHGYKSPQDVKKLIRFSLRLLRFNRFQKLAIVFFQREWQKKT